MGCSSGRPPYQSPQAPALPALSSLCDAECGLPLDGMDGVGIGSSGTKPDFPPGPCPDPTLLPKSPENFTLERLSQATGGAEKSWYRCVFPFGFISLVIGMAGTSVTFTFNTLPQIKVVSLLLLVMGVIMLFTAALCWRVRRARKRAKKEGGIFSAEQGTL